RARTQQPLPGTPPRTRVEMRLNELLLRPFGGAREAVPARSPAVLARAERRRRSRRWGSLASPDFRRLWLIGVVAFAVRWLAVWHLALASFVNGIAWAADNPVRRVMIGEVVGPAQMSAAMSIDVGANNASRMLGPTIGGLLLAGISISGAFTVSVLCYGIAL